MPGKPRSEEVQSKIDKITSTLERSLTEEGDLFRTGVLLPFCRRHKLTYAYYNGNVCFKSTTKGWFHRYRDEAKEENHQFLLEMYDVLELTVPGVQNSNEFASYVGDITEGDLKNGMKGEKP